MSEKMPKQPAKLPEYVYDSESETMKLRETGEISKNKETSQTEVMANQFERLLSLRKQYEYQKTILKDAHILETLSTRELGIKGIDGKEYPFPSFEEISKRLMEKKEVVKEKYNQGFSQLLIVPFGMSLDNLMGKIKEVFLKHHQEGKLFAAKQDPNDPDEAFVPLELGAFEFLWRYDEYEQADIDGKLVYYPTQFDSKKHGGLTKSKLLKKEGQSVAWTVLLLEDLPNLPKEGEGANVGGRRQLETYQTPKDYLKTLQTKKEYSHESGLTPEAWLTYAITHMGKTNQVIDVYPRRYSSVSWNIGAYFSDSDSVPIACWDSTIGQVTLDRYGAGLRNGFYGARSVVKV